jgi:hypothetical protein
MSRTSLPSIARSPSDLRCIDFGTAQTAKVAAKLPWQFRNKQSPGEAGGIEVDVRKSAGAPSPQATFPID